jgi:hypothetical protein
MNLIVALEFMKVRRLLIVKLALQSTPSAALRRVSSRLRCNFPPERLKLGNAGHERNPEPRLGRRDTQGREPRSDPERYNR